MVILSYVPLIFCTIALTFAGSNTADFKDDMGSSARFNYPYGIAVKDEFLYVVDSSNNRIRKVGPQGTLR